jgi:molybdenum cofactor cytidylyltransferase
MVGDKPGVNYSLIDASIDRYVEINSSILYVKTPSGRGHPIIFSKRIFGELLTLEGDIIGDQLIERNKNDLVELYDDKTQIDIDTEQDYRILTDNISL